MDLKTFQCNALDTLRIYLERARVSGNPEEAFLYTIRLRDPDKISPSYRTIQKLPGVPNVCLRLPTGAGKTLLAAYTIGVASRCYLERDYPVVLWLVPTNTIRRQTAEALKKVTHSYRASIDAEYEGRVSVFDISEIEQIRPQDLTDRVCIIVSTIQTLRVNNTEGRRAYAHSEHFEPHFSHIPHNAPGLELQEDGRLKFSFVNLMAFHRPLVIVDEAHKAGTNLSFDMLAALRPSCIVEFTATPNNDPQNGSNVVFRASAAEVKAAEMIKLPVILTEHPDWRAAIHDTIDTLGRLAGTAKNDRRYIRPLALFQAQDKGQEVTVDILKKYLMDNENIAENRIAIATGEQRELDMINIFDPACPVEFIITVEALKEGWDCSFAYVLCSVANIGSATDIEQLLGRVLRMPYAELRSAEALNRAYAHVSSSRFGEGARALTDTLIDKMGFEPDEAASMISPRQPDLPGIGPQGDLFHADPVLLEVLDTEPDLTGLDAEMSERVHVAPRPEGGFTVSIRGEISEALEERLVATVTDKKRKEEIQTSVHRHRIVHRNNVSPAEQGVKFAVPRLFVNVQGKLELAEKELILDLGGWTLNDYSAQLSTTEFSVSETAERWEVDLMGDKVVYKHLDQNVQLEIGLLKLEWTDLQLSRWLDRECRQKDITQPVLLEFCRKVVAYLMEERGISLNDLNRFKYQLAKAVQRKIAEYRKQAYDAGYQNILFKPDAQVETCFADGFAFEKSRPYPASGFYKGAYRFQKHFFGGIGDLESKGEEYDCAVLIDNLPEVKHWIRNLSNQQEASFWLPTSTDRFYPDFVAELNDGRVLVIEYKGAHLADTQDTKEKKNIGELWADKSQGRGLFLMAEKKNAQGQSLHEQLMTTVTSPKPASLDILPPKQISS